ncbi:hypothetical protein [Nocardia inohanensis]|uniref:hypothetical protein n=1 Tax=Nocardia inohanensis TaxID=209246 RepID=UPI00082DAE60|nr:hypothetical protein [Nocardia inohanensis]
MGAKFATAQPGGELAMPDLRRYAGKLEGVAAFLGAVVAGLLLMAPLDLAWTARGPILQLDMLVLNMPRAAAAGAVFAAVAAGLAVALGRRSAWVAAFGSMLVLLAGHLTDRDAATTGTLTTVNYIDSIFGGILLGTLAVAAFGKPLARTAFLIGALSAILIGDLTALPAGHVSDRSLIEWASSGTPPLWLIVLTVPALAVALLTQWQAPAAEEETADLPIGPILAALLLTVTVASATEWFVRHADNLPNISVVTAATVLAGLLAALLLPGRDGALILLMLGASNAASAIVAVPRPDWSAPIPVVAVAVGYFAGRRLPNPWIGVAATAALSIFAALTAGQAHTDALVPVIGITAVGLVLGYCFAAALPGNAPSVAVGLAVLLVPCLVIAVRGNDFGRVAYSPRWYRDPQGLTSAAPGWVALGLTVGCALALALLYRIRRPAGAPALSPDQRPNRVFTQANASG